MSAGGQSRGLEASAFRALHELAVAAGGVLDPATLASLVVDRARRLLRADAAGLYWWDAEEEQLRTLTQSDIVSTDRQPVVGQGIAGRTFVQGQPIVVEDYEGWAHSTAWAREAGVKSAVGVPLVVRDQTVGVLVARAYRRRQFSAEEVQLLGLLAAQVGPALEAARLYAESERRRQEAEALAELARQGATEVDTDRVIHLVCETAARLVRADYAGLQLRDQSGCAVWRGMHGNRASLWRTPIKVRGVGPAHQAIATGRTIVVERLGDPPGAPIDSFPVHQSEGGRTVMAVPLFSRDGANGALLLGWRTDIRVTSAQIRLAEAVAGYAATVLENARAHARAQQLAREAADRAAELAAVMEQMPSGVLALDQDGRPKLINEAARRIFGLPPARGLPSRLDMGGLEFREPLSGRALAFEELPGSRALAGRPIQAFEYTVRRRDQAEPTWVHASAAPLRDDQGQTIGAITVFSDVTAERRLLRELAASEERLRTLHEAIACGVLVHDVTGELVHANGAAEQIFGYSREAMRGRLAEELWQSWREDGTPMPDEERPVRVALRQRSPVRNLTVGITRSDGALRWLQVNSVPMLDEAGRVVQVVSSFIDITERKRAEEGLKARARQQAVVTEFGWLALAVTDVARLFHEAARLVARTLGLEHSLVLELSPDDEALVLRAGFGWRDHSVGQAVATASDDGQFGCTLRWQAPIVVEDWARERRLASSPLLERHGVRSGATVTIQGPQGAIGVLGVHSLEARAYDQDEVQFLQTIANVLAAALERRRSEEARERLAAILEATTDYVSIDDRRGRRIYLNRAGRRMLGVGDGPVAGLDSRESFPDWALTRLVGEGVPAAVRDGVWSGELAFRTRDGLEVPVSLVLLAHRSPDGVVEYFSCIGRDITQRKRAEEALAHQALHDALTGLPNRALLDDRLDQLVLASQRDGRSFALLVMDLDRFKEVNDTLGHHAGDLLLKCIAARLLDCLRASDTVARLGGDEFALILPTAGDLAGSAAAARKILRSLEQPFLVEGHCLEIGGSIGIALYPEHGEDAAILLRRADVAMYVAKRSRSGFCVYRPDMDDHSPTRLALVSQVRQARDQRTLLRQ